MATTVLDIIPSVLWVLLAATAIAIFYRPLRNDILPNLTRIKLPGGIELSVRERVGAAAAARHEHVSETDKTRVARRLARNAAVVDGARILWVDDHPERNVNEAATLGAFGAVIRFATNTGDARSLLSRERFDAVITDWRRKEGEDAGKRFIEMTKGKPWTIFYVGRVRPTPPEAFALTTRPHELLHFVLDALERERG